MKKRLAILCTTVLAATFTISSAGAEQSREAGSLLLVPAHYPTIQECIYAATAGDTCLVAPGTYVENIDFGKAIAMRSESGADVTIIDGNQAGSVVTFSSGVIGEAFIDGFTIRNGDAEGGGGIYCDLSDPTITNCTISGNRVEGNGGGIRCSYSHPSITNCTITENSAGYGGGIYCKYSSPTITNCTILGNSAYYGGGIRCRYSDPMITNCVLWGNAAPYGPEIQQYSGSPVVTYSDVQGGWPGEGNIDSNPLFIGEGDYHLRPGSPCIDAGVDAGVYMDIDGDARPQGAGFDMGADECTVECVDDDDDGYYDEACGGIDCDDTDPGVNPGAQEICTGGIDEDCDGLIDSDDPDCVIIHVPADQPTIQSAIDMALDGNLVLVAPGTYVENIHFMGKAITLRSEAGADETTIDGNQAGSVVTFSSGVTKEAVIDGFTIRNGYAQKGGGIYCKYSSPTITNCTISGNIAEGDGGGIYFYYSPYYSPPTITNCAITGNIAGGDGGGIYCSYSPPAITNCTITGNIAEYYGGGIYCYYSDATITNCTISGNSATGLYSGGGGIYCDYSSLTITNCILWGDYALYGPEIDLYSGSVLVTYSDVQGGWPGEGNIDLDPLLVGEVDYHLTAGSPCIDTGIDIGVYADIDGDARPQGAGFDIGSDEYTEYWDGDMDGYGDVACGGTDCDDADPGVNPGAQEICTGGIDEDCDGFIDSDDSDCVTIHVPADQPTIQSAIDMAADGNLVVVSPGTYVENIDFLGKAIAMRSEAGVDVTIIDGNQAGSVVTFSSGVTDEAFIEGFTIRNGDAYNGGGIYCYYSHPSITNCTITGNSASYGGGGICCDDSFPTITNCTITDNIASVDGGGIYCDDSHTIIANCTIMGNIASGDGGGIYCYSLSESIISPLIMNCTVSGNSAEDGGGICCDNASPMITNCTISDNSAEDGGGIYCYQLALLAITNCTITGNSASAAGGGLWGGIFSVIVNCTITGNNAYAGGGIYGSNLSVIVNCTITGNIAHAGGGIYCIRLSFPTIINCIFWANSATLGTEIYIAFMSAPNVSYSDVQGGEAAAYVEPDGTLHWGDGNIDSDPLFIGGGDYHLTSGSPCIDAGTDAGIDTDIDGDARPMGAGVDMGSDEYPDCGQDFTIELDTSYAAGTLSLDFTLGTPEEATWATSGILLYPTVQVIPLWERTVPRTIPPVGFSVSFPCPSTGVIGIWTSLYTAGGPQAIDLAWVDTGRPSE